MTYSKVNYTMTLSQVNYIFLFVIFTKKNFLIYTNNKYNKKSKGECIDNKKRKAKTRIHDDRATSSTSHLGNYHGDCRTICSELSTKCKK